ncbi:exo-beta-1,3-glucanase [Rickenella mellea]|uniref:Exo-beta-1,3-glucanase n=1 Tax=Rickenella mellea TaxID=50990 RepID=A0A4Y7QIX1_9AGAM|nr:exo-beta-1,3-glucanase [Rickenella mellea]
MSDTLGTTCSSPLQAGTASANAPFWLESIKHQGKPAFNSNPNYPVFRNVKDYGAKGDGVTDDTAAVNAAISYGDRCGQGCDSSTVTPAIVYFPYGTYLISSPIIAYYYTQIIGDAKPGRLPTLLAAANFNGIAVIDADPYIPGGGGAQWYINQNNFFRSVRNFRIDLTRMPAPATATGFHWQVSQATSLMNIVVDMSTAPGTNHQGIFMENGSGGFMGDLVFNGGRFGIWVGNQQFTVRNITVNNANTGIYASWSWGWTFQGVVINNCEVGFDLATGALRGETQTVGAEAIIDAVATNTPVFVRTSTASNGSLAGSIVLNNIRLVNVPTAVGVLGGATVLSGGTTTISSWAQGNIYSGTKGKYVQGPIQTPTKASCLLDSHGNIFGKTHPQYHDFGVDQFVSVKDNGAVGDGVTDDTAAIVNVLKKYAGCKIIFFDHGTYLVTNTITIPTGTQIVGEAWSVIMGGGSVFSDINNPRPVVRAGEPNSEGGLEITDMIFTTRGPAPGAVVLEWNVHEPAGHKGAAGMWDSHIRLGGALGTNLGSPQCRSQTSTGSNCFAAFLALHLTPASSAYLEGTWVWLADHDLDNDHAQITVYSGRGILSQSMGPVWMIGTAEHHTLYQYNLAGAQNHYLGLIQTETAYYQPSPPVPSPWTPRGDYYDPSFNSGQVQGWALRILDSNNILIYGAGLYSFFQNYDTTCVSSNNCQTQLLDVDTTSNVYIYSLSTVATTYQLSISETGVIEEASNANGFASTITAWTRY